MVSTCNRVEVYGASPTTPTGAGGRARAPARAGGAARRCRAEAIPAEVCDRHLYERAAREAVHHLFRVAASLDSLVVGEPQILGPDQGGLRRWPLRRGRRGRCWARVFRGPFRVARKVRRDTGIAAQPVSVSSVAVDLARQVWSGFEGRRVLVVGAGKMADLAARVLRASGATLAVTNRTRGARRGAGGAPRRRGRALGASWRGRWCAPTSSSPRRARASRSWRGRCWSEVQRARRGAPAGADRHRRAPRRRSGGRRRSTASTCSTSTTCRRWWPRTWRTAARRPTGPRR